MVLKYIVVFYGALFLRSTPNLHFTNLMLSLHYSSTLPFSCGHSLSCSGGGPGSRRRRTRCWSSWRRGTRDRALSPDLRRGSSNPNRRRFLRPNVGRSQCISMWAPRTPSTAPWPRLSLRIAFSGILIISRCRSLARVTRGEQGTGP